MWTKQFWRDTAERAVKTAAQFGLFAWGTTAFTKVGDVVNTGAAVGLALLFGAGLSILTSAASINVGPKGSPSLITEAKDNG